MTAARFVDLFGLETPQRADWRFSRELCAWAKPGAVFGPGYPPKTQGVLLGANRVVPKEK